ncbi:hypothetical protein KDD17_02590 [Sulfitobacter albidus]|uniref:Uncharacterized protein n=1 Tax=Sulfitobacter albidus TaxID=2829501 RepID=A0A975JED6_9RHOB|nr:hypothetical protein [Sulfitobacter albidus]QUJ76957.1 hypothetical protein KDD17_02590 [Sulfitobacter albidus]
MAVKAKFDQGFTVTEEGGNKIISFTGNGLPWIGFVILPFAYLGLLAALLTAFWMVALVVGAALSWLIYSMYQPQAFTLTAEGLVKNGVEYEAERISEISIDNPMDDGVSYTEQPGIFVGGTGVVGASVAAMSISANLAASGMVHASQAISNAAAKRRHRVRIKYGAKSITIARNLKQGKALAIFDLLTREQT